MLTRILQNRGECKKTTEGKSKSTCSKMEKEGRVLKVTDASEPAGEQAQLRGIQTAQKRGELLRAGGEGLKPLN
jgi:hypothetical protein